MLCIPPARAVDNPGNCFLLLPLLLLLTRFSIYFVWLLYVVVSIFFSEFSFVQFYFFAAASLSENFINCFASTCGLKSPSQHHNPYIPTHTHNTPLSNQLTFFRKHFFLLPIFFLFTVFLLQIKFVSNEWAVGWQAGAKAFMPLWQVNFNFIAN